MSAVDVQAEILDPMQRLFYPPRKMEPVDEQAALRDYVGALHVFPAADLSAAWAYVRDTHPKTSWPVPAAFVQAASRARKDREAMAPKSTSADSSQNERWEVWKAVCRSPLAYEAVKRNVAWSLKCAVLHQGKKPDQISLTELVSGKYSAERTAARIKARQSHEWKGRNIGVMNDRDAATALSMWNVLQQRETETHDEIRRAA